MTIKKLVALGPLLLSINSFAAESQDYTSLSTEREQVIHQYILDLENADSEGISALFEPEGTVVSTSRGYVNAYNFFHGFLPEIVSANTVLHQSFVNNLDNNRFAVRFHFSFKLKDGETGDGEYIDEFVFSPNSAKLSSVYMFENLKFHDAP